MSSALRLSFHSPRVRVCLFRSRQGSLFTVPAARPPLTREECSAAGQCLLLAVHVCVHRERDG